MKALWFDGRFGFVPFVMALILFVALPSVSIAQSSGDDEGQSSYSTPVDLPESSGNGFDPGTILGGDGPVTARIEAITEVCSAILRQNRIHCLAYQYQALASQLPQTAEYYDMRVAIDRAARDLRRLATENVDPEAPLARVPQVADRAPSLARQRVPAVRRDTLDQTARAAEAILEETATVLLRSAENSRNRSVAYQRVAEAIDSSKVLLRSG